MATVGDFLLERLHQWGVRRIFGYPGDGINGIMAALGRREGKDDDLEFIQTRHEEMAAFMACAHAKFTGEVGVCLATSGPGAVHLLNGLYDAKLDHQPVVAIVGQQKRSALGANYQQEIDLMALFKDVAGEYVQMATTAEQVRHLVDRALRIAKSERCVTCIIVPNDLQEEDAVPMPPREHGNTFSGVGAPTTAPVPPQEALAEAAAILDAGNRVAILAGAGAHGAEDELVEVAELLGAGVAKALLGKAVIADDLPFVTGSIGIIGTKASNEMMEECDTLLMVGSSFPYAEFLPPEGQARGVQIDIDGRMLSLRYPMESNLVGDAKATLRALIPHLQRKTDQSWRERIEAKVADSWRVLGEKAMEPAKPVNPQRVFTELSPRLPDDVILAADSGSAAAWYALDLRIRRGMLASLSGGLATMGSAVPYALAAKLAHPDRPVIALAGDGAMQMNGINGLMSVAWHRGRWTNPTFIVLVLNNRDLNFVTWEQRGNEGEPKYEPSQQLPDFSYAEYARLLGIDGERVEDPEALGAAWERALTSSRPYVLEVVVDPNIPPLPPHTVEQQKARYEEAIAKGDEEAAEVRRGAQAQS
ncbi:thiamine pyrophosphate-requiring protein [Massilia sp. G4R7]|uniref:Thiamine pyrophosphate-requiring protein n=1 Tax=Massilia phyllostachyos TaxID=2898585 RepID=A0ABS8Q4R7_9BURK|nr:thiamine pyrophosphate-requiring protein [Massilia phyllostachyos]MCD2516609.1 thiamine pyrophosphate-requiring protein [Massilia phyllostachyos]